MSNIMLWLTGHRVLVVGTIAATLWVLAYYFYFWRIVNNFVRSKPRSWGLDMVNKQPISRGHRNSH